MVKNDRSKLVSLAYNLSTNPQLLHSASCLIPQQNLSNPQSANTTKWVPFLPPSMSLSTPSHAFKAVKLLVGQQAELCESGEGDAVPSHRVAITHKVGNA